MKRKITLKELAPFEKGTFLNFIEDAPVNTRLTELGFTKGSVIECIGKSPFSDPKAYFLKGTILALRNVDAKNMLIMIESP